MTGSNGAPHPAAANVLSAITEDAVVELALALADLADRVGHLDGNGPAATSERPRLGELLAELDHPALDRREAFAHLVDGRNAIDHRRSLGVAGAAGCGVR